MTSIGFGSDGPTVWITALPCLARQDTSSIVPIGSGIRRASHFLVITYLVELSNPQNPDHDCSVQSMDRIRRSQKERSSFLVFVIDKTFD